MMTLNIGIVGFVGYLGQIANRLIDRKDMRGACKILQAINANEKIKISEKI